MLRLLFLVFFEKQMSSSSSKKKDKDEQVDLLHMKWRLHIRERVRTVLTTLMQSPYIINRECGFNGVVKMVIMDSTNESNFISMLCNCGYVQSVWCSKYKSYGLISHGIKELNIELVVSRIDDIFDDETWWLYATVRKTIGWAEIVSPLGHCGQWFQLCLRSFLEVDSIFIHYGNMPEDDYGAGVEHMIIQIALDRMDSDMNVRKFFPPDALRWIKSKL